MQKWGFLVKTTACLLARWYQKWACIEGMKVVRLHGLAENALETMLPEHGQDRRIPGDLCPLPRGLVLGLALV